jgi:zinc ribbon protein
MKRTKRTKLEPPAVCPVCGEDVPRGSLACPNCGADHNSGWREDAENYDGLDLPDESFDYDEFVQREFGSTIKPTGIKTIWWITAIIVLAISIAVYFFTR